MDQSAGVGNAVSTFGQTLAWRVDLQQGDRRPRAGGDDAVDEDALV